MHRIIYLLLLASYLMVACRTGKSPAQTSDRQLVFGNGGGFTGQVTSYTLLPNGQIQSSNSLTQETKQAGAISRKKAADLLKKAETVLSAHQGFEHPGNRYFFLKIEGEPSARSLTWGDTDHPAPTEVQELYDELLSTIKP